MHTRLAAGLLSAPLTGEAADVLWRAASFEDAKFARTQLSEAVADEIITTRDAESVTAFVKLIPSCAQVSLVVDKYPTREDVIAGALANPWIERPLVEKIRDDKSLPGRVRALALSRISHADDFVNAARTSSVDEAMSSLDALISRNEYSSVIDALMGPDAAAAAWVLGQVEQKMVDGDDEAANEAHEAAKRLYRDRLDFRIRVLDGFKDRAGEDAYDELMYRLLGLNAEPEKALSVDRYIADWLCSDSFWAQAAQALLLPEGGVRRSLCAPEFAGRLTQAARQRFKQHDTLWDLVAYKTTRALDQHALLGAKPLDMSQLKTYRLIGMSADEISGWFFGTNFEVETEDMLEILDGLSPRLLANLILGFHDRYLQEGQAFALLSQLDDDDLAEVVSFINADEKRAERLKTLPWYQEVSLCLPGSFNGDLEASDYEALAASMVDKLGDDGALWTQALDAAETWPGSFTNLLASVG